MYQDVTKSNYFKYIWWSVQTNKQTKSVILKMASTHMLNQWFFLIWGAETARHPWSYSKGSANPSSCPYALQPFSKLMRVYRSKGGDILNSGSPSLLHTWEGVQGNGKMRTLCWGETTQHGSHHSLQSSKDAGATVGIYMGPVPAYMKAMPSKLPSQSVEWGVPTNY